MQPDEEDEHNEEGRDTDGDRRNCDNEGDHLGHRVVHDILDTAVDIVDVYTAVSPMHGRDNAVRVPFEKRLRIRPAGVLSKYRVGDLTTESSIFSKSVRDARRVLQIAGNMPAEGEKCGETGSETCRQR